MTHHKSKNCPKDDRKVTIIGVLVALLLLMGQVSRAQQFSQTIKGNVRDTDSREALIGATVQIIGSDPIKGAITDVDGNFKITEVPVGRVSLQVSYTGYESMTLPNIVVTSGKEVVLNANLRESALKLAEVVVTGDESNGETLNEMVLVSGRSLSTEEMARITASFNDPAL